MTAPVASRGRNMTASWLVAAVMPVVTLALMPGCSTAPDGTSAAQAVEMAGGQLRLAQITQPAGDPGNVIGQSLTLDDQRTILEAYRAALYSALTASLGKSRVTADCQKCPVLTSHILAIDEEMMGFPSRTEFTVLFSLAEPGRESDALWSKVIKKGGKSYNPVGVLRVRGAREDAVAAVLRELVAALPADVRPHG